MELYHNDLMREEEFLLLPDMYDDLSGKQLMEAIDRDCELAGVNSQPIMPERLRGLIKAVSVVYVKEGRGCAETAANYLIEKLCEKGKGRIPVGVTEQHIVSALQEGMIVKMHNAEVVRACKCSERYKQRFGKINHAVGGGFFSANVGVERALIGMENLMSWIATILLEELKTKYAHVRLVHGLDGLVFMPVPTGDEGLFTSNIGFKLIQLFGKVMESTNTTYMNMAPIQAQKTQVSTPIQVFEPKLYRQNEYTGLDEHVIPEKLAESRAAWNELSKIRVVTHILDNGEERLVEIGGFEFFRPTGRLVIQASSQWWKRELLHRVLDEPTLMDIQIALRLFGVRTPTRIQTEHKNQFGLETGLAAEWETRCLPCVP